MRRWTGSCCHRNNRTIGLDAMVRSYYIGRVTSQADTAAKMIEIATAVCAKHTVVTDEMYYGEQVTWSHTPTVECANGVIYITMDCNRVATKAVSAETVRAAALACTVAWDEAGLLPNGRYKPVRVRGHLTWSLGFWHMGQWCATAYRRAVKVPAVEVPAAA